MTLPQLLQKELEQEATVTRKMLERVPADKFDWQPHTKSMTLRQLAAHVAELPGWITMVLTTPELDFAANPYTPQPVESTKDVLDFFEESLSGGKAALAKATDNQLLNETWVLREGDQIYSNSSKYEMIRITFGQMIHHRAQLGVYLRLLDIPIPATYGPSADETGF